MNRYRTLICFLLLISLAGVGMAEEIPSYVVYVQGGESSIIEDSDGEMIISVQDLIPFFHLANGKKSDLIPVRILTNLTYPLNAALVFSGTDYVSTSMVKVSNLSLSDGNKLLTLHVHPLKYYEGVVLSSLASKKSELSGISGKKFDSTSIYIEGSLVRPTNYGCGYEGLTCWDCDCAPGCCY